MVRGTDLRTDWLSRMEFGDVDGEECWNEFADEESADDEAEEDDTDEMDEEDEDPFVNALLIQLNEVKEKVC